jgi:hypothetical protein
MNNTAHKRIEDVRSITEISEGKILIEDASREASLSVNKACSGLPLSTAEPHLSLFVKGEDFATEIELDGEQMDALADAVYHIQNEYGGDSDE